MSSEIIVVLVLTVLAIGFIIWVRMNSQGHAEAKNLGEEGESGPDRK